MHKHFINKRERRKIVTGHKNDAKINLRNRILQKHKFQKKYAWPSF